MKVDKVALVGNPNTGKSSLFNQLTGLNQHVGNFPGVTVDKKSGKFKGVDGSSITLIDLPGTFSVYPGSKDEQVVFDVLNNPEHPDYPDAVIVVVDSTNLERNLLLFTQIYDLGLPVILALNLSDVTKKRGTNIDPNALSNAFDGIPVVETSARKGTGIKELKQAIADLQTLESPRQLFAPDHRPKLDKPVEAREREAEARYEKIREVLREIRQEEEEEEISISEKLDNILVHKVFGYVFFVFVMFLIFQAIYTLAEFPMTMIDEAFLSFSQWTKGQLPTGPFTNLLAEGIIPGLGGILVFIPQIALLFGFLAILEETGYMSRVVFIMDRLMRPFGLNGKSVVPLMSSIACAIPGVMATRTISNWRDRIITIMVAPLMSCSARIPVYTLLIALVIPDQTVGGFMNMQGLVLLGLYFLGLVAALGVAAIMKLFIKSKDHSVLMLEMPEYRPPRLANVGLTVWEKVRLFIWDAGRVIMAISIILWGLASYGPGDRMEEAAAQVEVPVVETKESVQEYENKVNSAKLQNSYIGIMGKTIEPVIEPLGYDWKIGIALVTSFAAREVFVGSMATIYSVGEDFEESETLINRMKSERDPESGDRIYSLATGVSLMIFYAFAMQCMATLAVVRTETGGWKWPMLQMLYMGVLAYCGAWLSYVLLS